MIVGIFSVMICHCSVGWFWCGLDQKSRICSNPVSRTTTPGSQTQQNLGFFVSKGHNISTALHVKLLLFVETCACEYMCVCVCWQADVGFASTWEHRKQLVSSTSTTTQLQPVQKRCFAKRERCEMCCAHINRKPALKCRRARCDEAMDHVVVSPRLDRLRGFVRVMKGASGGGGEEKRRWRPRCQVWKCAKWEFL